VLHPNNLASKAFIAVASEAICKWGAQCRRKAPAEIFLMCPSLFSCAPTWGGTTILCYRLRDNWTSQPVSWRLPPSTASRIKKRLEQGYGIISDAYIHYYLYKLQ